MANYKLSDKTVNFLAFYNSFRGSVNREKHHDIALSITRTWMKKYKPNLPNLQNTSANCCK